MALGHRSRLVGIGVSFFLNLGFDADEDMLGEGRLGGYAHGRSGKVALPRTKVTPEMPACLKLAGAPARRAERMAVVRRRVVDMVK